MRTNRAPTGSAAIACFSRSEEHTSELQSLRHLVCRLLLDSACTSSYTLSLHDALPIFRAGAVLDVEGAGPIRILRVSRESGGHEQGGRVAEAFRPNLVRHVDAHEPGADR